MLPTVLALVWFPFIGTGAEISHDVGLDSAIRGRIDFEMSTEVVRGDRWHLDLSASVQTYVRENTRRETVVRISPEQIRYPVGVRLRFELSDDTDLAVVARHQSNHDIDTTDERLNRETISYEVYGLQWVRPGLTLEGGLYYDRGTRLSGHLQQWPFNYYVGGLRLLGEVPVTPSIYLRGDVYGIGHRDNSTQVPFVDVGGTLDAGWQFLGEEGRFRSFLRLERLNSYQFLGDRPHHLLLLGVSVESLSSQAE